MTKRYIEVARQGKNDWWRYIFGWIIPPVIIYAVAIVGYVWPTTNATGVIHISGKEFWNLVPTPVGMIFVVMIMAGGGFGVYFVTTKLHKRPFSSLVRDLQVNRRSSVGCVSAQQNASPTRSKMMRCPPGQHILGWIGMIIYREIPEC
jgi:ethanolamine transporter EutH